MSSLNPALTIGEQIAELLRRHRRLNRNSAMERALEMLRRVRIPAPEQRLSEYPYQMSGGMRQRAMIAMALANDPKLLIADEPTTALDVTVQQQVLDLMKDLQQQSGTALIMITHDLGVVAEMADQVAVMYAGRIVDSGPVAAIFDDPQHPYTIGLMSSMPSLNARGDDLSPFRGLCLRQMQCLAAVDLPRAARSPRRPARRRPRSPKLPTDTAWLAGRRLWNGPGAGDGASSLNPDDVNP